MNHHTTFPLFSLLSLSLLASCGSTPAPVSADQTASAASTLRAQGLTTRYVDPVNGKDTNDGLGSTHAYRTLARGLKGSAAGDTLKLLPGVYGKLNMPSSGDTFPLQVPAGVTIQGSLSSTGGMQSFITTLPGADGHADDLALTFAGDATIKDVEFGSFDTALTATKGKLTLSHLNFIGPRKALELWYTAQVMLSQPYFYLSEDTAAVTAGGSNQVTVDGGTFDYWGGCTSTVEALRGWGTSVLHIHNSRFNRMVDDALAVSGQARGDLTDTTLTAHDTCRNRFLVEAWEQAQVTLTRVTAKGNGRGNSFLVRVTDATMHVDHLNASGFVQGIVVTGLGTLNVVNSTFDRNTLALFGGVSARLDVATSTFTSNQDGIKAYTLKLRDSRVIGGSTGITANSSAVDLGGSYGTGNNVFGGSQVTSVRFRSLDGGILPARGNTWNPDVQLADHAGRYETTSSLPSGTPFSSGKNFILDTSTANGEAMSIWLH